MKWTADQEQELRDMYASNTPARVIAKLLGRSKNAVYCKAAYMGLGDMVRAQVNASSRDDEQLNEKAYRRGMTHREKGRHKSPPSRYTSVERAWFLAGWHDRDIELGGMEGAA